MPREYYQDLMKIENKSFTTYEGIIEVVICVYAGDIERNKIRGDYGITYDMEVLRLIDDLRSL